MKHYWYFIDAEGEDVLPDSFTVYNVAIGEGKGDQSVFRRLKPIICDNSRFYFTPWGNESTPFVRNLFKHYQVSIKPLGIRDLARYLKSAILAT